MRFRGARKRNRTMNKRVENRLEVRDLHVTFPVRRTFPWQAASRVRAVNGVSFAIEPGSIVGLVGESGSGKSTIARAIMGLVQADAGQILLGGMDLCRIGRGARLALRRSRRLQMIWQDPAASLDPRFTVRQSLLAGWGRDDIVARAARARQLIRSVGLPERVWDQRPGQMSGGQNQRVAIARALLGDPAVLVADEPTSALDVSVQAGVGTHLAALTREAGSSCLLVSHDLSFVSNLADQVIVLYLGTVMEQGPALRLMTRPRHPYTAALLGASPQGYLAGEASPRYRLRGELPSPLHPPSGCQFRTRCPFAEARCAEVRPVLRQVDGGGMVACHVSERLAAPLRRMAQGLDPGTSRAHPSSLSPHQTDRTDFQ